MAQARGRILPTLEKEPVVERSLHLFMDMAPHDMAVRLYAGEISISNLQTSSGKKFRLLNMPYYLASEIDRYLEWFN